MQRLPALALFILILNFCLAQDIPVSVHYNNGLESYKSKDFKEAVYNFTKAIASNPAHTDAYYQRGRTYLELKYYVQALVDFDKTIELNPKHTKAYYTRGYAKFLMKNYRGSVSDFNFAIEINPQSALAYFYRGEAKHSIGETEGACIDWNNAIRLGYANAGDFIQKYCEESTLSSQKYLDKIITSGNQKFNQGDFQGALTEYDKALQMNPEYGEGYVSRGLVNLVLGFENKACADWKKAAELGNPEAKDLFKQHCN